MKDRIGREPDTALDLDGPIWRFALAFYGRPGMAGACLALQDEAGVDVIALIVVLYSYAVLERGMDAADVEALRESMAAWREETVLPLRGLRRRLKAPLAGFPAVETELLRDLVKKAELKAEQIQLAMAARWITARPAPARQGLAPQDALPLLAAAAAREPSPAVFASVLAAARAAGDGR